MSYRSLNPEQAHKVMDWCEANGMEWEIWNGPETLDPEKEWELGVEDWDKIPTKLYQS